MSPLMTGRVRKRGFGHRNLLGGLDRQSPPLLLWIFLSKKIDVEAKLLRRVQCAAGGRIVERAPAEDQGSRGFLGHVGGGAPADAAIQAAANRLCSELSEERR